MSKTAMIAKLPLKPGTREEFLAAFAPLVEAAREEAGTLVYAVHTDDRDENLVWVYELYADAEALAAHAGSDAMKAAMGAFGTFLGGAPELIQVSPVQVKGFEL